MIFEILEVAEKAPDWKVATVKEAIEGGQTYSDVSINEKTREGAVAFTNFADIKVGSTIEADYWRSATNKQYLFAPKPKAAGGGKSFGGAGVKAAQERKSEMIEKAQDNKNTSIMIAAAMRDAGAIALAALKDQPFPSDDEFIAEFTKWRDWYLAKWKETEKVADQPF